jgi:hypothetical protein
MSFSINTTIDFEKLLEPMMIVLRKRIRETMEKHAADIVTEEMAKFAIELSKVVSFQDFRDHIVITVKKEIQ